MYDIQCRVFSTHAHEGYQNDRRMRTRASVVRARVCATSLAPAYDNFNLPARSSLNSGFKIGDFAKSSFLFRTAATVSIDAVTISAICSFADHYL